MRQAALDSSADLLRPFFLVAVVAFVLGFAGYLAAARSSLPETYSTPGALNASAPSSDAWNFKKTI